MNEHFARSMHNQKMASYYAEADSSRLAARTGRPGLRERIRASLAIVRRPQVVEKGSVRGHISKSPSVSKVG